MSERRKVAFLGLGVMGLLLAAPAFADTLIDDINGISIARDGTITRFSGLVVDKDGKITQVLHQIGRASCRERV